MAVVFSTNYGASASSSCLTSSLSTSCGSGSRVRRDFLLGIEKKIQSLWEDSKVYEVDAPSFPSEQKVQEDEAIDGSHKSKEKFFCTFPYAYMNGPLHLGHAFSMSKVEFSARFQRMLNKKVLWPYAFHCTGMPIFASAVKLRREIEEMNEKNKTENKKEFEEKEEASKDCVDISNFISKKSKVLQKNEGIKSQYELMLSMNVSLEDIPKFINPKFWLHYFPSLAVRDLKRFGTAIDWRRTFITTDVNPYYDAFIKWQFRLLRARNKVKFGMRNSIFSRLECQPCADHDRALGEGVCPQEYTLIKLEVQQIPQSLKDLLGEVSVKKKIFLIAATLRPETLYGQTNCFVLPEGNYGFFLAFENPLTAIPKESTNDVLELTLSREEALKQCGFIFVCSRRSAINMSYQGIIPLESSRVFDSSSSSLKFNMREPHCLFEVSGQSLIGLPLSAPKSIYSTVYTLPMLIISMDKGTGIVTSVPSDSPADYAALQDLKNKIDYFKEKYDVREDWINPFDPVEIINVPSLGTLCAVELYKKYKISSQRDHQKLELAKDEAYRKGFLEGILMFGSHKGLKVCEAKNILRDELINEGFALSYFEPEKKVLSRSGGECIVAKCNQWFIDYGEHSWKTSVEKHINDSKSFNAYSERALNQFQHVLQWLKCWSCSRHCGLGSALPWDGKVMIESLSDSTIYMCYYTISHFLQGDMNGSKAGLVNISAESLTDEVFNYIFCISDVAPNCEIPKEHLSKMRNEFSFWYPMDLRASGKDLIFNHLTMSLYNHAAIWNERPQLWPRGFFCNGMVMVDAEKMSKSKGNFLTLEKLVEEYGADASRIALADAGDSLDDANFQRDTANSAIMKLFIFEQFVQEILNEKINLRIGKKLSYDIFFENEIIYLVETAKDMYLRLQYREALKAAFFFFQTLRDNYRTMCGNIQMHRDSILLFIETQVKILAPITPHVCEHIWKFLLKKPTFIVNETWPTFDTNFDSMLHRKYNTLLSAVDEFRSVRDKMICAKNCRKGKQSVQQKPNPTHAIIYVAREYNEWQQKVLKILQTIQLDENDEPPADFMNIVKNHPEFDALDKSIKKNAFSFASYQMKEELKSRGRSALDLHLPFDEIELLKNHEKFISNSIGLKELFILKSSDSHPEDTTNIKAFATPGKPSFFLYTSE